MFVGIYRFICDIVLSLLWAVAVVLALLFIVLIFACAIIAGLWGLLLFAVMMIRDYPNRPKHRALFLKL